MERKAVYYNLINNNRQYKKGDSFIKSKNNGDRYLIRLGEMNLNIGMALKWIPFK